MPSFRWAAKRTAPARSHIKSIVSLTAFPAEPEANREMSSEKKIDAIENRLDAIEVLLQSFISRFEDPSGRPLPARSSSSSRASTVGISEKERRTPCEGRPSPRLFAGASSLSAHSNHARSLLEGLLKADPGIRHDPEVLTAFNSLHVLMQKEPGSEAQGPPSHELPLPPYEEIAELIASSKDEDSLFFFIWSPFFSVDQFTDVCRLSYGNQENGLATNTFLNATLYFMTMEHVLSPGVKVQTEYHEYSEIFKSNFHFHLSQFSQMTTPSYKNILALALGATYGLYIAAFPLAWSCISMAANLCQSIGWHRGNISEEQGLESPSARMYLFWVIYCVDKSLSLRMGRSSNIQDFDVAVARPQISSDSQYRGWQTWFNIEIELAAVQGLLYERLYSPGSNLCSAELKTQAIQHLAQRLESVSTQNSSLVHITHFRKEYMAVLAQSNEILIRCLLTLVHRAAPPIPSQPLIFNQSCLQAARATMHAHTLCVQNLEANAIEHWQEYSTWVILNCPFTPFMVLFCHVVSTLNADGDLRLLEGFIRSINKPSRGPGIEAMATFNQLCTSFFCLARRYVAIMANKSIVTGSRVAMPALGQSSFSCIQHRNPMGGNVAQNSQDMNFNMRLDTEMDDFLATTFDDWMAGGQQPLNLGDDCLPFAAL
ncbi:MAG: hypothetical protein M1820_000753 [Bogoriella megaspora]|nr:MAG: hypothetical protein M1820_000753 [Bogoriella megaspora]